MSDYKPGAAIRVNRPRKSYHNWLGRITDHKSPASDFCYVAFRPAGGGETAPEVHEPYNDKNKFTHVLLPVGQLKAL